MDDIDLLDDSDYAIATARKEFAIRHKDRGNARAESRLLFWTLKDWAIIIRGTARWGL